MASIADFYDKNMNAQAGAIPRGVAGNMNAPFDKSLLHLVYFLIYDPDGRKFLRDEVPGTPLPGGGGVRTDATVRAAVKAKCEAFGVTGQAQDAMIGVHFAGTAWVAAYNAGNAPARLKEEAAYKQHLAVLTWALWDEASGPLFPLPW